ncbi:MAG: PHP domain-containing protein [Clostridiales bacterium]|nr:PHP domain-containing protein [Clostridiales bacterium]
MRFLSNAHTHTTYCDGKSTAAEMIEKAKELGFSSLGFSGHGQQDFDSNYAMDDGREQAYLRELRALQQQETILRIWAGVEEDILAPEDVKAFHRQQMDYVLCSSHYVHNPDGTPAQMDGQWVAIDGSSAQLRQYVDRFMDGDGLAMAKHYYDELTAALRVNRVDIIGHFDLIRKNAVKANLFDEKDLAYRRIALDALESVRDVGVLEINTGAMARGYMETPYPTLELLGAWREMGGEVTITSDCHHADYLNFGFDTAMKLLCRAGYRRVLRLGRASQLWEEERVFLTRA